MKIAAICIALLVAVVSLAQNPADDPGGWTIAKWGMTQDQIKAAFPDATQVRFLREVRLGLPAYVIGPRKFVVAFGFDASGGLQDVSLFDEFTAEGMRQFTETQRISAIPGFATRIGDVKDDLLSSLTAKYGNFSDHAITEKGTQDDWSWLLPGTTIKLNWRHAGDSLDGAHLYYKVRKKSSDL